VVEWNAVADVIGRAAIYFVDFDEREIFFAFFWRADGPGNRVAGFQPEKFYLRLRNVNVVGRIQVVEIRRPQEPLTVGHDFEDARVGDDAFEFKCLFSLCPLLFFYEWPWRRLLGCFSRKVVLWLNL
jgi:hypothetical protein